MKGVLITYWISTLVLSAFMVFFACLYLLHAPAMMAGFAHLGYPSYLPDILGVAKLLGVAALLVPGIVVLKEWAYAGFAITFIGACVSHLTCGDGPKALPALIALGVLAVSYFTRPADRCVVVEELDVVIETKIGPEPGGANVAPPRPAHG